MNSARVTNSPQFRNLVDLIDAAMREQNLTDITPELNQMKRDLPSFRPMIDARIDAERDNIARLRERATRVA